MGNFRHLRTQQYKGSFTKHLVHWRRGKSQLESNTVSLTFFLLHLMFFLSIFTLLVHILNWRPMTGVFFFFFKKMFSPVHTGKVIKCE